MNILEKEFVPYEPSLALKELGFDEPCFGGYDMETLKLWIGYLNDGEQFNREYYYPAPTFSQAFRWFREKYNIDAWVQPFVTEKSNGTLFLPDESYSYYIFKDGVFVADKVDLFDPEEAELACLKKLIEIVKKK
jgi:hypothetical protein